MLVDGVKFTWRTVRLKNADGSLHRVTCSVLAEADWGVVQTTFAYWIPEAEALRKAQASYRCDMLRRSYGRPFESFTPVAG